MLTQCIASEFAELVLVRENGQCSVVVGTPASYATANEFISQRIAGRSCSFVELVTVTSLRHFRSCI